MGVGHFQGSICARQALCQPSPQNQLLFVIGDRVFLHIPGCPTALYVDQAGFKLRDAPVSAS